MNKGYADYLIAEAREFDRELMREAIGVESPMFRTKFEEWLAARNEISAESRENYMRWLRKADEFYCSSCCDSDFWTLLKKAWTLSDFENVRELCRWYEEDMLKDKSLAAAMGKEEFGESEKEIGNWLTAFRKYQKFLNEKMQNADIQERAQAQLIRMSRISATALYLEDQFMDWCLSEGLERSTAEPYGPFIKRVNRELFCKMGYDLFYDFLPSMVKAKNVTKIDELFGAMDAKLTERIESYDESEMPLKGLRNGRTALRAYAKFIKSLI